MNENLIKARGAGHYAFPFLGLRQALGFRGADGWWEVECTSLQLMPVCGGRILVIPACGEAPCQSRCTDSRQDEFYELSPLFVGHL